ncbi:hypothetical protein [Glycomyces algeriensis]|uniref:Uncharacterized protein n=1 Tax=Glycomyces algeriensis TaxID=256037 RepID=A0A9W6GB65_9ACTN|nr:hypothetical protein [Glycomyces algeriensis]MDA1367431.1 hypothetical protein [Glycomyces algeriensis]MDR7350915.1 putative NADH-flavin reductase [Glycomyces algeriensis]GLI43627.1 hypothetical protein GALLR39Z86_34770 [Glycomyces algeriensis]
MKHTAIAATGGDGRAVLAQALEAGHDVAAVARAMLTAIEDRSASHTYLTTAY